MKQREVDGKKPKKRGRKRKQNKRNRKADTQRGRQTVN